MTMGETNWSELAAMLTVMAICGGFFTWIVAAMIDRKMGNFEKSMREGFVTKEVLEMLIRQADETHARHEKQFAEIFHRIGGGK